MSDYYVVEYELWPLYEVGMDDLGRHTDKSTYEAENGLDAINAALYHVRGRKSNFEMAWISDVYGPYETETDAKEVQYDELGSEVKTLVEQMEDAT